MRVLVKQEEIENLSTQLKEIATQLEDMTHQFERQIIEDAKFVGEMATSYQLALQALMKEHQRMIQFYQELSKEMIEMKKDYEEIESLLINRIENL